MRTLQRRCARTAVATGCVLLALSSSAHAADSDSQSLPDALRELTDPFGIRSTLEAEGLRFTFSYYGDAFANPIGGVKQGPGYDGRFGTIVDADLAKLMGWNGASFHASFHDIFGTQFSATNLSNLMTVSGIEASPSVRLFNAWIEQKIGTDLTLRLGQFTAAQEFVTSRNATLFVNATFGWPMPFSQDLPSGAPNYPEATPGARLAWTPNDSFTLRAAAFNGDPAGPGPGNPVERDPFGVAFRINDPPFFIFEGAYEWGHEAAAATDNPNEEGTIDGSAQWRQDAGNQLPGAFKLGAWIHTGYFADQRLDASGGLLAVAGGPPMQHHGDFAVYAVLDQQLWVMPYGVNRGLSGFLRTSFSPSDRNPVDLYADGGLTFKGPFATRPDDIVGLGVAWGRISPAAQAYDRDLIASTGQPIPVRDYELGFELTYQWKLADKWIIQPDLQYIVHPGAHIPVPGSAPDAFNTTSAAIPDALVIGLRTIVKF
jgi:porin